MTNSRTHLFIGIIRPLFQTLFFGKKDEQINAAASHESQDLTPDASMSVNAQPVSSSPIIFDKKRWPKWLAPALSIFVATLIYYILAQSFSGERLNSPFETIANDGTNPYLFGVAVQEMLLPLVLLVIFMTRPLFQSFIAEPSQVNTNQVTLIFALVELSYIFFVFRFGELYVAYGLFVIAAAGLIGGWRMGLAIGLLSFFVEGTFEMLLYEREGWYPIDENVWYVLMGDFYVGEIGLLAKIWAGYVAGHAGKLISFTRLGIGALFLTGLLLETIPGAFTFLVIDETYIIEPLLAAASMLALVLVMFMIIATNVRNQAQLRFAEINRLALTQAELRALRAQINPHFLFNSLNTIRFFVRTDPEQARQLLLDLSDVFQVALKSGEMVPLKDEIDFTRSYLALEKARLDERLDVSWFVQNDDLLEVEVPTLMLQPVVENAIIHGIAPKTDGGRLQIMIMGGGDDLVIQVIDDGMGMDQERLELVKDPDQAPNGSIGTNNIQQRLRTMYKERGQFKVESTVGKGTTVELRLPMNG
ncbi:MAG: histidine kinase [Chloroflexota bacterium]